MADDVAGAHRMRVLLLSDPGLPSRRVNKIQDKLEARMRQAYSREVELITRTETIRLRPDNTLDIASAGRLAGEYDDVDAVLLLTEIPRHSGERPLVAEVFPEHNVGVVSCPTLGAVATKRRILTVLMDCMARLIPPAAPSGPAPSGAVRSDAGAGAMSEHDDDRSQQGLRWTQWSEHSGGHQTLRSKGGAGSVRTVLGMTMANDPWRTAPRLSSALAAAAATGAFGIFYSSIWQMAAYLSTARLISIGVVAVVVMVSWLIVSNGLWDRPIYERLSRVVVLYNLSTILTLLICVAALYLSLVVLILLGGLIIIAPEFMATILDTTEVRFTNYLDIAWLSAALGVVAGGLGSSFDSRTDLRKLTHGQRERQRQYATDDDDTTS